MENNASSYISTHITNITKILVIEIWHTVLNTDGDFIQEMELLVYTYEILKIYRRLATTYHPMNVYPSTYKVATVAVQYKLPI